MPASALIGDDVVGTVEGGLLGGLLTGLVYGEGGLLGNEGGVLAGDDELGDVIGGFADVVSDPNIGGEDSFGEPTIGSGLPIAGGLLGGVLGGLLSGGTGLLGGVF